MLWMLHSENLESLAANSPKSVRQYLTAVGDFDALREWDAAKMNDKFDDTE